MTSASGTLYVKYTNYENQATPELGSQDAVVDEQACLTLCEGTTGCLQVNWVENISSVFVGRCVMRGSAWSDPPTQADVSGGPDTIVALW